MHNFSPNKNLNFSTQMKKIFPELNVYFTSPYKQTNIIKELQDQNSY